ncbi:MAG: hypothetical protein QM668_20250 [Agriterribacter sp.]
MNRQNIFIVIVASILLSFLHCPLFEIFFDDKEIFKYTGLVMLKGGVPYRDFFDHKPPLIYVLNYFGLLMGTWGLWIIDSLLVLSASLFFLHRCIQYKVRIPWILPVLFNLLLRNHAVSVGIGMTREYTAIFLLFLFCIILSKNEKRFLWMGLLTALIFFMQQDQVLIAIPFILYTFLISLPEKRVVKQALMFTGGFILISVIILGYFAYNQSLNYFWKDAFLFNFQWYNKHYPVFTNLKAIRNRLHDTAYEMPFYMSFVTAAFTLVYYSRKRILLLTCIIMLIASFTAAFVSGKMVDGLNVSYYFLPLSTSIPIVLFALFNDNEGLRLKEKKPQLIFSAMIFIMPLLSMFQYATNLLNKKEAFYKQSAAYQYLQKQQLKDYDLYVAFNSNNDYLYNEFSILAPSKWIYHFFWVWFDKWDADRSIFRSIINELQLHKTKYILDSSDGDIIFKDPEIYNEWKHFLITHYEKIELPGIQTRNSILWKHKD